MVALRSAICRALRQALEQAERAAGTVVDVAEARLLAAEAAQLLEILQDEFGD